jgi:hypothetical protein
MWAKNLSVVVTSSHMVPSCGRDPGLSPVGQIETRNWSVYFELRKFPLNRDKGSAYWRTKESSRKRGESFRSEKNVGGYDMSQVAGGGDK